VDDEKEIATRQIAGAHPQETDFPGFGHRRTERNHRLSLKEIGCGTGALVERLPTRLDVCGADVSSHAIEIIQSSYPKRRFHAYRRLAELSESISRLHVGLLLDLLEHSDDDFELLSGELVRTSWLQS